ncbi:MAG: hypothetical protein RL613_1152 [Fusobacteriota bacterium]
MSFLGLKVIPVSEDGCLEMALQFNKPMGCIEEENDRDLSEKLHISCNKTIDICIYANISIIDYQSREERKKQGLRRD